MAIVGCVPSQAVYAEILTIGDELCRGEIIDTNSAWLAAELWDLDVTVRWMTSCRDDPSDMQSALRQACDRADLIITSGGLGPTQDDLTVDVVSELVGVEPVVDPEARARLEARLAKASLRMPDRERQLRVPSGARVLGNPAGLAPAFEVALAGTPLMCLPGIPREIYAIFEAAMGPRIAALRDARPGREHIARRIFRMFGRGESQAAADLKGLVEGVRGASLHYQVKFPEVLVKLAVRDTDSAAAEARLTELDAELRKRLGADVYGIDGDSLAAALGRALMARNSRLATAESCTGGLLGGLLTEVAGSSVYFAGGAIVYANDEKIRQLGVRAETLAREGAVSQACVEEMARGARERFAVDYAVAVSGVAGPGGGSADKPVGTVWLAVAGPNGERSSELRYPGARDQVRRLAAYSAMKLVLAELNR